MSRKVEGRRSKSRGRRGGSGPERLGDAIARFLDGSALGRTAEREALEGAWRGALGSEAIAAKTRLLGLGPPAGVLRVEVASAALLQELATFERERLIEALRKAVPEVRDVRFKLGTF